MRAKPLRWDLVWGAFLVGTTCCLAPVLGWWVGVCGPQWMVLILPEGGGALAMILCTLFSEEPDFPDL